MKHTKAEISEPPPIIATDTDIMRLGLQTLSLGIQYQIRTLQEQLNGIQERAASLTVVPRPSSPKLLHVAPANGPRPKRPAEIRAMKAKLPMPDIGKAKDGKALHPSINLRKVYQWALEHDGALDTKIALKRLGFKLGSRGSIIRGGSFRLLFEPVPGEDRVYRLKKAETAVAAEAPAVKDVRGVEHELSGHGLLMFNWAVAHQGRFELVDFREHHRHLPPWQLYPQNMSKGLLSMLTPVPGKKLTWQLKPEYLQGAKK